MKQKKKNRDDKSTRRGKETGRRKSEQEGKAKNFFFFGETKQSICARSNYNLSVFAEQMFAHSTSEANQKKKWDGREREREGEGVKYGNVLTQRSITFGFVFCSTLVPFMLSRCTSNRASDELSILNCSTDTEKTSRARVDSIGNKRKIIHEGEAEKWFDMFKVPL